MNGHVPTRGLIAAPFTPLHTDRQLNLDAVPAYASWLHDQGVVGAFICGTTGEGMSLTLDERRRLAERWVASAPAELRVIVHVGHNCLADCQALAAHAAAIGASSVACMSPFFFRPPDVAGLVTWCSEVAAAAPQLPFYYYHIPSMTGMSCRVSEFLSLAVERIPNLAGVKFTFEDLADFERCLQLASGRLDILFGRDELLLSALDLGAQGAVGSTYNFAASVYQALIAAQQSGQRARAEELQALAVRMIDAVVQSGAQPVAAFKWLMGVVGIDCGPPRLPLCEPTLEQQRAIETKLEETGIFAWLTRRQSLLTPAR